MLKSYSKSLPNCNGDCGVNRSAVLCAVLVHWTAALSDSTGTTSNKTTQRVTSMLQYANACQILRPVCAQSQIFKSGRARIRGVVWRKGPLDSSTVRLKALEQHSQQATRRQRGWLPCCKYNTQTRVKFCNQFARNRRTEQGRGLGTRRG